MGAAYMRCPLFLYIIMCVLNKYEFFPKLKMNLCRFLYKRLFFEENSLSSQKEDFYIWN